MQLSPPSQDHSPVSFRKLLLTKWVLGINAHKRLISVRSDIKPDNILLDAHGHVHLTDFNVAIHYSERRLHTSVAGSMAYMAPEILARTWFRRRFDCAVRSNAFPLLFEITGRGYTWHVDYWSLGVCVFELLFGRRPFESRSVDKLTQAIMKGSIKFPPGADDQCSKEGQNMVLSVSIASLPSLMVISSSSNTTLISISSSIATRRRGYHVGAESEGWTNLRNTRGSLISSLIG